MSDSKKELLAGRVALVTGGGQGIGEACGRILAEYGAKVILADLNEKTAQAVADSLKAQGSEAAAMMFDVADFPHIREKVAQARSIFGRIDILVNVAGIAGTCSIEEITF